VVNHLTPPAPILRSRASSGLSIGSRSREFHDLHGVLPIGRVHALNFARMKRSLLLTVACFILAGFLWLAWAIRRDRQLQNGFDLVKTGATEMDVLRILGQPKRVESCGEFMGPLEKKEREGCVKEYFYASPLSPLVPKYYVVRFDDHTRVSNTALYASP